MKAREDETVLRDMTGFVGSQNERPHRGLAAAGRPHQEHLTKHLRIPGRNVDCFAHLFLHGCSDEGNKEVAKDFAPVKKLKRLCSSASPKVAHSFLVQIEAKETITLCALWSEDYPPVFLYE